MSERGRRGWVRPAWSAAILAGWLVAMSAQAQHTVVGTTDDSQGGFVVIEDTAPPPAPPKPVNLPATKAPLSAPARTSAYKPGSAAYEIPWAKHPAASGSAAAASSTVPMAPRSTPAPVAKAPVQAPSTHVASSKPVRSVTPPTPRWSWTIKQGYSIQQQLMEMAKGAHWNVVWNYNTDILAGADWTSHEDFPTAAEKVIKILAANGALIHYHTFDGNNTFLVCGPQPCPSATRGGTGALTP